MPFSEKTIGVVGGMGPEAALEFLHRLLLGVKAERDQDHIHVILDNNSKIPPRVEYILEGKGVNPLPVLEAMALGLRAQGAQILAIPCNTAHYFHGEIASRVDIPVMDMIDLAVSEVKKASPRASRVGILATSVVMKLGLYERRLEAEGLQAMFPNPPDQARLLDVIKSIKAIGVSQESAADFADICTNLANAGADVLLVACTELSLLTLPIGFQVPWVDALDALVGRCILEAKGLRPTELGQAQRSL